MKNSQFYIFFASIIFIITSCSPTKHLNEGEYLLEKVNIEIDGDIDEEEIGSIIKQQPNRKSLRLVRFHLGIYNMFDKENVELKKQRKEQRLLVKNKKRIRKNKEPKLYSPTLSEKIIEVIGEEPVLYDGILTEKSTKNINQFLINSGYFNGYATDSVNLENKKATVNYYVKTGLPYKFFKITYRCFDLDVKHHIDTISNARMDASEGKFGPGKIYGTDILESERERMATEMKNRGYYYFNKEYIYMEVDTNLNKHKVNIKIVVTNPIDKDSTAALHQRYRINNVYIHTNYNAKKYKQEDYKLDTIQHNGYYYIYHEDLPIRPEALEKNIFVKKGHLYNLSNVSDSHRRLSSMRIFKYIRIDFTDLKTDDNTLDANIYLTTSPKMSLTAEVEGTHEGGFFGIAGNLGYRNKNALKGGEIFETKFSGGMQVQQVLVSDDNSSTSEAEEVLQKYTPFNTIELMPEMSLYIPGLWIPFLKSELRKFNNPTTKFSLAYSHQRRTDYTRDVLKFSFGYTGSTSKNHSHLFYPAEISYVNIDKHPLFEQQLLATNNQYLINTYQNHLILASKYSYTYNNQDLSKPNKNYTYILANLEGSGNIMRGIGNLTGFKENANGGYEILGVQFAQYVKPELDIRRYMRLGKVFNKSESWMVYRLFTGVGIPYGNLSVLPFEKSYYGGGANGIRAWEARTLGPGSLNDVLAQEIDQIADIHIEANIEYRFEIIEMLEGAIFLDAGNIWLRNEDTLRPGANFELNRFYKEIGLGAGVGTRLNLDILIIRLDLGLPLYNPNLIESERWFFNDKTQTNIDRRDAFGFGFSPYRTKPVLNIGIGYPF